MSMFVSYSDKPFLMHILFLWRQIVFYQLIITSRKNKYANIIRLIFSMPHIVLQHRAWRIFVEQVISPLMSFWDIGDWQKAIKCGWVRDWERTGEFNGACAFMPINQRATSLRPCVLWTSRRNEMSMKYQRWKFYHFKSLRSRWSFVQMFKCLNRGALSPSFDRSCVSNLQPTSQWWW